MRRGPQPGMCRKQVHDEGRGVNFHNCPNKALAGTTLCGTHTPRAKVPDEPQTTAPTIVARTVRRRFATLTWEPGEGPRFTPEYGSGDAQVALTRLGAEQYQGGNPDVVSADGVVIKANGTPGRKSWSARFPRRQDVPEEAWEQALHALAGVSW